MHEGSRLLVLTFAFACLVLMAGVCAAEINLIAPEFDVKEGDRTVEITWHDPQPQALVSAPEVRLGSAQYPWRGKAGFAFAGFYQGACDWTYDVSVVFDVDSTSLAWSEVSDWKTLAKRSRLRRLDETDHFYNFSDSIKIMVPSAGLFVPGFAGWDGAHPGFSGIYRGGAPSDTAVTFDFVCASGGELGSQPGAEVRFDWTNSLGQSGSVAATQAGAVAEAREGFKVTFVAGSYPAGQSFSVLVMVPFARTDPARGLPADVFKVRVLTFEGYLVLRRSVEDKMSTDGDTLYKVIADISRCEDPAFFADLNGRQDPFGMRRYRDKGIEGGGIGVTPDSAATVVLNGFPYKYSVLTYDWSSDYRMLTSDTLWTEVFPSVSPIGKTIRDVYVVPNPYTFRAGWEQGEAKLQFVNVPIGAVIKIFDASGGYISTVVSSRNLDGSQSGTADWHLVDSDGEQVVSGVYMFRVEAGGDAKMGRFIVIR